jgi:hypothetical protein
MILVKRQLFGVVKVFLMNSEIHTNQYLEYEKRHCDSWDNNFLHGLIVDSSEKLLNIYKEGNPRPRCINEMDEI